MTVSEMLSRMSGQELTDWEAYYRLEPFGAERGDLQAGIVAATLVNSFQGKGAKPVQPSDFLLQFSPDPRKAKTQDWTQMLDTVKALAASGLGTITTAGGD